MKKILRLIICSISLAALTLPGFPQAGTLDSTFSDDGIAAFSLNDGDNVAIDVVALPDSSLMLCGITNDVTAGFIAHVLNDGEQDTAFGTNGYVEIQYGSGFTEARRLIILPDNKIIVSGHTKLSNNDHEFFIARFLPDGSPDLTFNSTGHWISSYGSGLEKLYDMIMQPDGKFIMAGQSGAGTDLLFMRVNANGTIDNSFGTNGYTAISISASTNELITDVEVLSNGTIVGSGCYEYTSEWYKTIMVKLTPQGIPMPGFGTNGVMAPALFDGYTDIRPSAMIVRNDSLLVTGIILDIIYNSETFLAKLDSSGNAATGFGTDGITIPDIGLNHSGCDIFRQQDGKLYVCGECEAGAYSHPGFALWRFMDDGTLDTSFNNTGYVITDLSLVLDVAYSMDLQPNGKIVLAGLESNNMDFYIALTRYLNDWTPGCHAGFSADPLIPCEGEQVSFTDLSTSSDSVVVSWQWTFEGGTPSSSTVQDPVITYNNDGEYDVQLIVSDGIETDTLLRPDYIHVESIPGAPGAPTGPTELCGTYSYNYSTTAVPYADEYNWQVTPTDAGTISGNGTTAVFAASPSWTGAFTIQVNAEGLCGTGPWSAPLNCALHYNPVLYQLSGTGYGGYCEGDPGSELTLDGSDTGVDYELYIDGTATGIIESGTGSPLSFGLFTEEGLYTAFGYTGYCSEFMVGQVYVHQWGIPGEAGIPDGPEETCENGSDIYTVGEIEEADWIVWTLDPAEAGDMTPSNDSVTITWNDGFSGIAYLSVHGENDCGAGPESDSLEILISLSPDPAITGPQTVGPGSEEQYQTAENPGNTYSWEVTGGTITNGAGTHLVTVLWGDPGTGSLTVTEETTEGCSAASAPYEVIIEQQTFIDETLPGKLLVYPNPADKVLCVEYHAKEAGNMSIQLINAMGSVVYSSIYKIEEADNLIQVQTGGITNGFYVVRITGFKSVIHARVLVIH